MTSSKAICRQYKYILQFQKNRYYSVPLLNKYSFAFVCLLKKLFHSKRMTVVFQKNKILIRSSFNICIFISILSQRITYIISYCIVKNVKILTRFFFFLAYFNQSYIKLILKIQSSVSSTATFASFSIIERFSSTLLNDFLNRT